MIRSVPRWSSVLVVSFLCIMPALAAAEDVKVTSLDGSRYTGALVSLSASRVLIRQKPKGAMLPGGLQTPEDLAIPLDQVRRIERISHKGKLVGLFVGAGAGAVFGWLISGDDGHSHPSWAVPNAAWAGGVGVGIGAIFDALGRDVLFEAPGRSKSVRVAPMVTPRHTGVAVALAW